jgi:IS5 family transposase
MQGKADPDRPVLDAAAWCRHLVPEGSVHAFLADHRTELFPDELFAELFPSDRGRPSIPGEVICSVMLLQELEGFSDRQAADALRRDIAWKIACGLALDDPGVHFTVFTYWRSRLRRAGRPDLIKEAVGAVIAESGVLAGRRRRALDSTVLADAVRTQDTVTQVIWAIRSARKLIPEAAVVAVGAHDYDQAGKPLVAWDDAEATGALITGLVNDALAIIAACEELDLIGDQADALGLLALVAGQDVEPGETDGTWRIRQGTAKDRVISTVDTQSRHAHKTESKRIDGFKAHIAIEPETGLITDSALTPANTPDGPTGVSLLAGEEPGLVVLADSAYGSGATRAALDAARHRAVIKPLPLATAVPGGFTKDDFSVDFENDTITCPAGVTVALNPKGSTTFGKRCAGCPLRARCTRSARGRKFSVHLYEPELRAARAQATEPAFAAEYRRWRPMVERSISWLVARGHRRVRFRGVVRNNQGLGIRVAAVNLRRLVNLGLDHDGTWVIPAT